MAATFDLDVKTPRAEVRALRTSARWFSNVRFTSTCFATENLRKPQTCLVADTPSFVRRVAFVDERRSGEGYRGVGLGRRLLLLVLLVLLVLLAVQGQ